MTDDRDQAVERRARPHPRSAAVSCPSCGAPLPAPASARASTKGTPTLLALTSAFLASAALIVLVVILRPPARPVLVSTVTPTAPAADMPREQSTVGTETAAATSTPATAPAGATMAASSIAQPMAGDGAPARPSASRGQPDWRFFFAIGDALTRMRDGVALGTVVRVEKWYGFPDGTQGPAYVLRAPQGEAIFDADELERGARIQ